MTDSITAPLRGTYWVQPGQFLAGEYPGEPERAFTEKKLRALIGAGIRTFVDLTDEDEINEDAKAIPAYRSVLRQVSEEESVQVTYANIPIEDRGVPSPWTLRCILDVGWAWQDWYSRRVLFETARFGARWRCNPEAGAIAEGRSHR